MTPTIYSCENVQQTTFQIKTILTNNLTHFKVLIPQTNPDLHSFLFSVHYWIAHLISEFDEINDPQDLLWNIINTHTQDESFLVQQWLEKIRGSGLTLNTLLYRHYLVLNAVDQEIFTDPNYPPLYILMASMLTHRAVFSSAYDPRLWDGIDTDSYPINSLRSKRSLIRYYTHQLAMREDETDHHLIRDHGSLSSLTLMYGLYLIRVILIHEVTVRPDPVLTDILESLSNTLINLKGVFSNVESHWLISHV